MRCERRYSGRRCDDPHQAGADGDPNGQMKNERQERDQENAASQAQESTQNAGQKSDTEQKQGCDHRRSPLSQRQKAIPVCQIQLEILFTGL